MSNLEKVKLTTETEKQSILDKKKISRNRRKTVRTYKVYSLLYKIRIDHEEVEEENKIDPSS